MTQTQSYKPSKYQQAIFDTFDKTDKNILVGAVAGSGKSVTITQLVKKTLLPTLFLAFNKSIQQELDKKIGNRPNVDVLTMHSLGMKSVMRYFGGQKLRVNENKAWNLMQKLNAEKWKLNRKEFPRNGVVISQLIDLYRMTLCNGIDDLIKVANSLGIDYTKQQLHFTMDLFYEYVEYNKNPEEIDFTDMVYLPATNKDMRLPVRPKLVLIDECFPYNQYINTSLGKKKIGIVVNDFHKGIIHQVLSYNEQTKSFEYKPVTNAWNKGIKTVGEIMVGGKRKIKCTDNHRLLTDKGWIEAKSLKIGDALLSHGCEQPYHKIPNEDQLAICLGGLIGDGSLYKLSKNINRFSFVHGEKQFQYLEWKRRTLQGSLQQNDLNGFSSTQTSAFCTQGLYIEDHKLDVSYIIENLTLKQLAIAWMDDGCLHKTDGKIAYGSLFSCATNEKNNVLLCQKLNSMFGIESKVRSSKSFTTGNIYHYITFSNTDLKIIHNQIAQYIHPNLKYKIYPEFQSKIGSYHWNDQYNPYGCMIISSEFKSTKQCDVYDIEVQDNHNFIITSSSQYGIAKDYGFIAHNCQDLNKCQHALIDRLIYENTARFIAVGDRNQSIYGFAGSDSKSFDSFLDKPNVVELPLSICYRCPKLIIDEANEVYDILEPWEGNGDGVVIKEGTSAGAAPGDLIICRNLKPLIETYFSLIVNGRKAVIKGKDIGKGLINTIKEFEGQTTESMNLKMAMKLIDKRAELIELGIDRPTNHPSYTSLEEKIDILAFLSSKFTHVNTLISFLEKMFSDTEEQGVILCTIHKAKGLEADNVFFLQQNLIPSKFATTPDQQIQEKNLLYVARTRAKKKLIYIEQ